MVFEAQQSDMVPATDGKRPLDRRLDAGSLLVLRQGSRPQDDG